MRKANGILAGVILILFLAHGILGGFQLLGSGHVLSKAISFILIALVLVHIVIGIGLTVDSLRIQKKTGAGYFRRNLLFWAGRISGFAIMAFLLFHMTAFGIRTPEGFRLHPFTAFRLVTQLLLVVSIAVHVGANVEPMLITFGMRGLKKRAADVLFVLSVLLLFMSIAFFVYYFRWH